MSIANLNQRMTSLCLSNGPVLINRNFVRQGRAYSINCKNTSNPTVRYLLTTSMTYHILISFIILQIDQTSIIMNSLNYMYLCIAVRYT